MGASGLLGGGCTVGRDTKVGLFVGFAFIVLFGVILSVRASTQAAGHADFPLGASEDVRIIAPGPVHKVDLMLARQVLEIPTADQGPASAKAKGGEPLPTPKAPAAEEPCAAADCEGVAVALAPRPAEAAPPAPAPPARPAPAAHVQPAALPAAAGQIYTVRANDSLTVISQRVYGTCRYWRRIYDANRHVLQNPDLLTVGQPLIIPEAETDRLAEQPRVEPAAPAPSPVKPQPQAQPEPAAPPPHAPEPLRPEPPYQLAQAFGGRGGLLDTPRPMPTVYVVRPGDNFYTIAGKVYGDPRLGYLLQMRNEQGVPDPRLLHAGQRILLLRDMPETPAEGMATIQ